MPWYSFTTIKTLRQISYILIVYDEDTTRVLQGGVADKDVIVGLYDSSENLGD